MKLGILFKRAIYRELRSSIGYYDARRIIRSIEKCSESLANVSELSGILDQAGFDQRQVQSTMEIIQRYSPLLKKRQDSISIDQPTLHTLVAPISKIAEKEHGITWLKGDKHKE
jgi:hypothetical protein